jgi:hypothetical protein
MAIPPIDQTHQCEVNVRKARIPANIALIRVYSSENGSENNLKISGTEAICGYENGENAALARFKETIVLIGKSDLEECRGGTEVLWLKHTNKDKA